MRSIDIFKLKKEIVASLFAIFLLALSLGKTQSSSAATITITVEIRAPKAEIVRPKKGTRICGDAVIIKAKSQDVDIVSIKFQYRTTNPGTWTDITSSTDTGSIYSVTWNTNSLPNGMYDLRAVATDNAGNTDHNPSTITVEVSHRNYDYSEDELKRDVDNVIEREDGVRVEIPRGTIDEDTIMRISRPDPSEIPPSDHESTGQYIEIALESGQKDLHNPIGVSIPYRDDDNNGMVDGTNIPEERLMVNLYNGSVWEELPTTIDSTRNIATGTTTHLTLFGIFGSVAPDLEDVLVYPNPFRPAEGTIKFSNLTKHTTIRIYNPAGELVRIEEDINTGIWEWDGENDSEEPVAPGGYIYIITNDEGEKRTGKIILIR